MVERSTSNNPSRQPIEFGSPSEEVAVASFLGGLAASCVFLAAGGFIGALGERIGELFGRPIMGGSILVWLTFWLLPLWFLMLTKPAWRFLVVLAAGAVFVFLLQWHIHPHYLGAYYPWILTVLPLGIVLGTFFEPIRLAYGGSTEWHANRGVTVTSTIAALGDAAAIFLMPGSVLGAIADVLALGRPRLGAAFSGVLGGGLAALIPSALVAGCGYTNVAEIFFGSAWNIAWAGGVVGAATGAISGWLAAIIHAKQHVAREEQLDMEIRRKEATPAKPKKKK